MPRGPPGHMLHRGPWLQLEVTGPHCTGGFVDVTPVVLPLLPPDLNVWRYLGAFSQAPQLPKWPLTTPLVSRVPTVAFFLIPSLPYR